MVENLSRHMHSWDRINAYASHVVILEEFVHFFERSVWAIRDEVRRIEKVAQVWCDSAPNSRD